MNLSFGKTQFITNKIYINGIVEYASLSYLSFLFFFYYFLGQRVQKMPQICWWGSLNYLKNLKFLSCT